MEIMVTVHVFIFKIFIAAFIASINATCPYDGMAIIHGFPETAKKIQSGQPIRRDTDAHSLVDRSDAYTVSIYKWDKRHITWKVVRYSFRLSRSEVDTTLRRAFKSWSDVCDLTFEEIPSKSSQKADIRIQFLPNVAEGFGRTRFPSIFGSEMEVNDSIQWTIDSPWGHNIRHLFTHELGHALGLDHSNDRNAVMHVGHMFTCSPNFQLDSDDIRGIQAMYGPPSGDSKGRSGNLAGPPSNSRGPSGFSRGYSGTRRGPSGNSIRGPSGNSRDPPSNPGGFTRPSSSSSDEQSSDTTSTSSDSSSSSSSSSSASSSASSSSSSSSSSSK